MSSSRCTDPLAADLSDDFMFGFDIEDVDKEYLAEVAKRGIGPEDVIKEFSRLSLDRGTEEWEQALCCASAMRDLASFSNPLDGQDILTFLTKIYRVDARPSHANDLQSSLYKPRGLEAKRKLRKICEAPDAEVPQETPATKKRRVKKGTDSPYWKEASSPVHEEDGQTRSGPEAKVTTNKKAPKKCNGPSEGANPPKFIMMVEKKTRGFTALSASEDPEPMSVSSDDQHKQCKPLPILPSAQIKVPSAPVRVTRGLLRKHEDSLTRETLGDLGVTISAPMFNSLTTRDSTGSQSKFESKRTSEVVDIKVTHAPSDNEPATQKATPKRTAKSPYFETAKAAIPSPSKLAPSKSPNKRPPRGTVSALPFPPLDSPHFGLIQEELADDPFRLLIAVTFLIRTSGKAAIPVFRKLMERYPTPADLADADTVEIVAMIEHLGFGVKRAAAIQQYAHTWLKSPPQNNVRYPVQGYRSDPAEGDVLVYGSDPIYHTAPGWEIGHLTQGSYALDSWRIFCRDVLRGLADDWKGAGREGEFQPEWMRVLPADKELRACLRWMWMREGWSWDPVTGEKTVLSDELRRAVQEGRVGYDDKGNLRIVDDQVDAS
ncbi:DNA glycosylase [Xylaria curta]|nr:DNA glycosylase [Xylaria curta]